jgi:hypothetical protein
VLALAIQVLLGPSIGALGAVGEGV